MPGSVSDAGLERLQKTCPNLERLALSDPSRVTDAGLTHLARMPALRSVNLAGNANVTLAGVEKLKKALPDCEVRWKGVVIVRMDDK